MLTVQDQIELFKDFFDENYKEAIHELIKAGKKFIVIDFSELNKFSYELAEALLADPDEILKAIELSLDYFGLSDVRVRARNLPTSQYVMIRNIRSEHLNNFIAVEGIVRQATSVRPQVVSAKFECPACGNNISILQVDTKFKEPTRCSCGRKGRFRLLSKDLVDAQRLIIEEVPESLEGEQPQRISVILEEDLVEPRMERKTTPGSKVRVYGVVKEVPIFLKTGVQSVKYDLTIKGNNIEPIEEAYEEIDISEEDKKKIFELAKDPLLYEKLINSVAPSIYGHELIKEALFLELLGGVRKIKTDGTFVRGDIHLLLVGDPGAAKSSLLSSVAKIAPKGRFVSGKGASAAGLTATVVKDEFLRGWALEAGAMVLANRGIAIIDELDKMNEEDRDALHEAMEQQRISIAKANIQATLKAETTVLAAANPKLGRFDPYTPIPNQINLPPTLINRFDLIFTVRDLPNKDKDEKIASHVLKMHQDPEAIKSEIPHDLLKKYIAYSRQYIKPKLSEQALDEIKSFYVGLRNQSQSADDLFKNIPISARQLEALVRLAEASAKVRLSDAVTRNDAKRAINLLRYCLMEVGLDYETGKIDIDRITTGITASKRSKILIVRNVINQMTERGIKAILLDDLIPSVLDKGVKRDELDDVIELLKKEGYIFEPKRGYIQKAEP
ncbi:MAG: minichromosome maintenance protein MCM [Nanoarchaeota archaeon]